MRSGSRCPAFYGEIPPMRWGILNDDGGYFYCITYTRVPRGRCFLPLVREYSRMNAESGRCLSVGSVICKTLSYAYVKD